MAHTPQSPSEPEPEPGTGSLDIGFKAGVGFYLGLIVAGFTSIGGILAGVSTEAVLATTPGTVTAVLIVVLLLGDRLRGLPERTGRSRRLRLGWYAPAALIASVLLVPAVSSLEYSARLGFITVVFAAVIAAVAAGVARMTKNRYIVSITDDEPAVTWTWQRTTFDTEFWRRLTAGGGILLLAGGLWSLYTGSRYGLWWSFYGGLLLITLRSDSYGWYDVENQGYERELAVHGAGVLLDQTFRKKLIPWDAIEDVRLTDEELILERRWLDVRCARSAIDDPEAVLEAIERTRSDTERGVEHSSQY
ncbi:hypothetical protein GS429_15700 [Natronorubrum sp. JWXQ-INN-674]|uniref:Low molecular weight protein antigen 6 PH domain-containing protein n=1 Tax=Natronorubrum halalkaliphilum TaxID=2691917 RepID=A0A6B0VQM3_9EURY|nr:PH domain-containing protein [Natronorubrum halalkaliphilum]MXV63473.1 hypothetical protein [Natronorubrum halalkaliphilum]